MTEQTCKTCAFVAGKLDRDFHTLDELRCRRYPPQSFGKWGDAFAQPTVDRDGWCGEWKMKEATTE